MSSAKLGLFAVLCALSTACGGHVNLGGKPVPGSEADAANEPAEPVGPDTPVGVAVARLPDPLWVDMLAVSGDYLYLANFDGLSRCQKRSCIPSLELLPSVGNSLTSLQIYEGTLAVSHDTDASVSFASYSLPVGANENVVIGQLPPYGGAPLWHGGFLYWFQDMDFNIYRCELPSCAAGPELVGPYRNDKDLTADGELLFWRGDRFIYRSSAHGHGAVTTLAPDDALSEVSAEVAAAPADEPWDSPTAIVAGGGMVYAALARNADNPSACAIGCQHSVVRWPVAGGRAEELFTSADAIGAMYLFGRELVWHGRSFESESFIRSCLADDCAATRRTLGRVVGSTQVAADERDLYWLESGDNPQPSPGAIRFTNRAIQRAPRLSPD